MNLDFEEILSFSVKSLRKHLKAFFLLFFCFLTASSIFIYLSNKPVYTFEASISSAFLTNSDVITQFEGIQNLINTKNSSTLSKMLDMELEETSSLKGVKAIPHDKATTYGSMKITLVGSKQEVLESFIDKFKVYLLKNDYIRETEMISKKQTQFTIDQLKAEIHKEQNLTSNGNTISINNNNIVEMISTLNNAERKLDQFSVLYLTNTPQVSKTSNSLPFIVFAVFLFSLIAAAFLIVFTLFSKNYYEQALK